MDAAFSALVTRAVDAELLPSPSASPAAAAPIHPPEGTAAPAPSNPDASSEPGPPSNDQGSQSEQLQAREAHLHGPDSPASPPHDPEAAAGEPAALTPSLTADQAGDNVPEASALSQPLDGADNAVPVSAALSHPLDGSKSGEPGSPERKGQRPTPAASAAAGEGNPHSSAPGSGGSVAMAAESDRTERKSEATTRELGRPEKLADTLAAVDAALAAVEMTQVRTCRPSHTHSAD